MRGATSLATKVTVRVERQALEEARRYAASNETSLSRLVSEFFRTLGREEAPTDTPILRRLSGILPAAASRQEHRDFLAKKYGG